MQETKPEAVVDDKPQKITADLRKFNKAEAAVNTAKAALQAITVIQTPEDLTKVTSALQEAKSVENKIETKRKELGQPFADGKKKIDDFAKKLVAELKTAIDNSKNLVIAYNKELEKKKLEERSAARKKYLETIGFTQSHPDDHFVNENQSVSLREIEGLEDSAWIDLTTLIVQELEKKRQEKIQQLQGAKENDDFFGDQSEAIDKKIEEIKTVAPPVFVPAFGSSGSKDKVKGITKTWTFEVEDWTQIPAEYLTVDETKIRAAITNGVRIIPGVKIYQKDGFSVR